MKKQILVWVLLLLLSGCAVKNGETSSSLTKKNQKSQSQAIVVSANPHATKAGADVLRTGGSAVDAAIAIQSVLSLVEPQSSGLGGGSFMMHYHKATNTLTAFNGRERAPKKANKTMFLHNNGKPMGFILAKNSGLAIGVPGVVAMLKMAHDSYGKKPWSTNFIGAEKLATQGFSVSPRMHASIKRFAHLIPQKKEQGPLDAYGYLFDNEGAPLAIGHQLKNPAYAKSVHSIAKDAKNFYRGEIAQQIIEQVHKKPFAGTMTLDDIAQYKPHASKAICTMYRKMRLCGPPPPSSWLSTAMIVKLIENTTGFSDKGAADVNNWILFSEAQRLAYADRDQFIGDPSLVKVPVQGLLSPQYLAERAKKISVKSRLIKPSSGNPWAFDDTKTAQHYGKDATLDLKGTSHFVVIDKQGNVVSMTTSVESYFGSTRMAGGMFLNNQLTDFSFRAQDAQGKPIANAVAPLKQPRSSMSPTIAFNDNGEFALATGSPGGSSIIAYTAKSIIGMLDWGLTPQEAINLPNMVSRKGKVRIEKLRASKKLIQGLRDFGYDVLESEGENSGLNAVMRMPDGSYKAGTDPRREGVIEVVY